MIPKSRIIFKLRVNRQSQGLSQGQIAKLLKLSLRTYQRIESGAAPLEVHFLYKFCSITGTDFYHLTRPEIDHSDIPNAVFFKNERDFFNIPIVKEARLEQLIEVLYPKLLTESKINSIHCSDEFNGHNQKLLLINPNFTIANKALLDSGVGFKEAKWKTGATWINKQRILLAWDLCLSKKLPGFSITTHHKVKNQSFKTRSFNYFFHNHPTPHLLGIYDLLIED